MTWTLDDRAPSAMALAIASTVALMGCSSDPGGASVGERQAAGAGAGPGSVAASGSGGGGPGSGGAGAGSSFTSCAGTSEAHAVFNAFWSAFDEQYALFDLRLPDESWGGIGEAACAKLDDTTAGAELFQLLLDMARHLDDGHSTLEAPELGLDEDAWVSEYPHYDQLYELEYNAEAKYLDAPLTWDQSEWFGWGTIGDVGYLSITAMEGISTSGDDEADEVAAAGAVMGSVMADLGGSQAIIVDVRANEGGWDGVSLEIARWFAGAQTLAWAEQRRNGPAHDDFGEWEDTLVGAAAPDAFTGPVVVLTSGGTFSAAETFLLAIRVRDQVTLLGERSAGHFSDQLDGSLPNGWIYQLSHERYRAADGEIYETRGVPVDHEVAFDVGAFATGQDVMLEAALALVSGK